jgi:hypothetical protein
VEVMSMACVDAFDDHWRRQATSWACATIAAAGWTLRVDPHNADGWEATDGERCLVVADWRDLCVFAKEVAS